MERTELQQCREQVLDTARRHGANNVRLFGSIVSGGARPDGDIYLLVDVSPDHSAWFPSGLILDLEDLLGQRVHVLTEAALRPYLRDRVLREAVPL
jgi:uncharacterized protein